MLSFLCVVTNEVAGDRHGAVSIKLSSNGMVKTVTFIVFVIADCFWKIHDRSPSKAA